MDKLLKKVLGKISPTKQEIESEKKFCDALVRKILATKGKHVRAELSGSMARSTHLHSDNDVDIFVFYPISMPRSEFEKEGLALGKKIFHGSKYELAYSEHPYVRGNISGYDVEIVPAYDISDTTQLQSAVDRTSFHNKYLLANMHEEHRGHVRLLKQFMKGVKCYGADLSANSFPGYVAELLVLKYGNFSAVLNAAAKWRNGEVVQVEEYYNESDARAKFDSHLVVVDPVDKDRNVAAALSLNQYARFIAAARAFSKKTSVNFFFPKSEKRWNAKKLKSFLAKTELVAIMIGYPKGVIEDVMWGQLRKFSRKTAGAAHAAGFNVKRFSEWLEKDMAMAILLEVETRTIQKVRIVTGPEVADEKNSHAFLSAHPKPISGPRIENGRWVIETERKYTQLEELIKNALKILHTQEKNAMKKAISQKAKILTEKEIMKFYHANAEFGKFLTAYLKGKEEFLDY